jgi:DNA-binding response OmpR family regulator
MWVLVVGSPQLVRRVEGGLAILRELGCRVRAADFWDPLEHDETLRKDPPGAVLVEALDQVEAGRAALARLRASPPLADVPILIAVTVSALQKLDPRDGFDDLVLVPYVPVELYVRIRRAEWRRSEYADGETLKLGPLVIDCAAREVVVDGRPVQLTQQEFALLEFLVRNRGRVFSRRQLLERVWGVDYYGGSRTVDIHVRRLRMKLADAAKPLETVRGVGYKMREP